MERRAAPRNLHALTTARMSIVKARPSNDQRFVLVHRKALQRNAVMVAIASAAAADAVLVRTTMVWRVGCSFHGNHSEGMPLFGAEGVPRPDSHAVKVALKGPHAPCQPSQPLSCFIAALFASLAVSAVNFQQGQRVADPTSPPHKPPYSDGLRKTHTIARNIAIPTPQTVRQAIQSPTAAQFVVVGWVADWTLCFIQHRLQSGHSVSRLLQEALGKTASLKCRHPRSSGFSSHSGQYGTTVFQTLCSSSSQPPLAEL